MMSKALDADRRKADVLELEQQAAAFGSNRRDEVWAFMKNLIAPARSGEIEARERLRSLLSRIDFRVVGDHETPIGGMLLTVAGQILSIAPAGIGDET